MESYAHPLRMLAERAAWFARAHELRLFHLVCDPALRDGALGLVMAQEYHADNASPFVRLDTPWRAAEHGWDERAAALRAQHDARREAMARVGLPLPALSAAPRGPTDLARFALQAQQVLEARVEPLAGLVVVLAPTQVEAPARWEQDLSTLLAVPSLRQARWVVIDVERPSLRELPARLAGAVLDARCHVDEAAARDELARSIEAAAEAPADAPGPAQVGAAWPRGVSPPRYAPTPTPEELAALAAAEGVAPNLVDGSLRGVRTLVLRAALAMRAGDAAAAASLQHDAALRCAAAGLPRETTLMGLTAATYVAHTGQRATARDLYYACAGRAEAGRWADLAAQALMAAGALHLLDGDSLGAVAAYERAALSAEGGGERSLAIEAHRMAGQLHAQGGEVTHAARCWTAAVRLAEPLAPAEARGTSAVTAGRALVALYRRWGYSEHARAVEDWCAQRDAPTEGAVGARSG